MVLQRHRAIHRIFRHREGFDIERLRARQHHAVVVRLVAVAVDDGDLLHIVGPDAVVQRAAGRIGTIVDPGTQIDFIVLGLAIFFGGLAGVLLAFPVGNVRIALSTSVGALPGLRSVLCARVIRCSDGFPMAPSPS